MKKVVFLIGFGLSLFLTQSCNDTKTEKEDTTVSNADVPASVQSAFSAKYSTATDVKWEDAKEDTLQTFKAKFVINGKKMKAEFDRNGIFVKEEEDN
jgi:hypothetical protein